LPIFVTFSRLAVAASRAKADFDRPQVGQKPTWDPSQVNLWPTCGRRKSDKKKLNIKKNKLNLEKVTLAQKSELTCDRRKSEK